MNANVARRAAELAMQSGGEAKGRRERKVRSPKLEVRIKCVKLRRGASDAARSGFLRAGATAFLLGFGWSVQRQANKIKSKNNREKRKCHSNQPTSQLGPEKQGHNSGPPSSPATTPIVPNGRIEPILKSQAALPSDNSSHVSSPFRCLPRSPSCRPFREALPLLSDQLILSAFQDVRRRACHQAL